MRTQSGTAFGPSIGAVLALGGLFILPAASAAGPWEAGASFGTGFFSHHNESAGYTNYRVHSITPVVRFNGAPRSWDIRFSAQRRLEFYEGAAIDSITNTSDHTADLARLAVAHEWSSVDRWTANASYARSHDLIDADESIVVVDGNTTRLRGRTALETYRAEAEAFGHFTDYEDESASSVGSATGRLVGLRSRIQSVYLGWTEDHYFLGYDHLMGKHTPFLGLRRRVSPLWSVELMGGAVRTESDVQGVSTLPMGALSVRTASGTGSRYDLASFVRFEGDSLAAFDARFAHRLGFGSVWIRGASLADVDAVVDRNPLRTRTLAIGAQDTVLSRNVVTLEAGYAWSQGLYDGVEYREGFRATGSWLFRVQPWLSARLGISYLNQPADASGRIDAFRRVRSNLELIAVNP